MDQDKRFSPDNAAAVWRRAAQLQAEAAQRLEERSRELSAASIPSDDQHNLTLEDLRAAAGDVGISPEFVALAVAEVGTDPAGALPDALQHKATRFLGTPERLLERSRIIESPVADVYAAMQRVLPVAPWMLALRDATGDPLSGGQLVFRIPELIIGLDGSPTPLAYNAYAVDVQQVQFMLRPVAGSDGRRTEILLRAGLQRSVRRNFRFGSWTARIMAVVGGAGGTGIGLVALGLTPFVAVPAIAGAALFGGGAALTYRKSYRYYLRKFTALLDEMLAAVAVHAKTGGSFAVAAVGMPGGEGPGADR